MWKLATLACVVFVATGCGDSCSSYSAFNCSQIDTANYNVHFSYASGTERHLGQVSGLRACGERARSFAASQALPSSGWGYVCCMIAKGSSCYEKHR